MAFSPSLNLQTFEFITSFLSKFKVAVLHYYYTGTLCVMQVYFNIHDIVIMITLFICAIIRSSVYATGQTRRFVNTVTCLSS